MFSRTMAYVFMVLFISRVVAAQDTKSNSEQSKQVQDKREKEEQKPPEVQPPTDQAPPETQTLEHSSSEPKPMLPAEGEKGLDQQAQEQGKHVQEQKAQEPTKPIQPFPNQAQNTLYPRRLAIGIATLKELGLAAGELRFRWNYIGADAAFGLMPVFVMVNYNLSDKFLFDFSLHATASLLFFFSDDQTIHSNGLRLGGVYDTIFGWGVIFGWQEEVIMNRWLSLQWGAGVQVYPGGDSQDWAKNKIRREIPGATNIEVSPIFSYVQLYIGFGLLFYLF